MSENSDADDRAALHRLIQQWRAFADEDTAIPPGLADLNLDPHDVRMWFRGRNAAYRACAQELAALLAAVPRPLHEEDDEKIDARGPSPSPVSGTGSPRTPHPDGSRRRRWQYYEPGDDGKPLIIVMSEAEILASYYPSWRTLMEQAGKGDQVTEAACLEDFVVVNWASPVHDDKDILIAALRSIANNSCCEPCREAGLVAKQALGAVSDEISAVDPIVPERPPEPLRAPHLRVSSPSALPGPPQDDTTDG